MSSTTTRSGGQSSDFAAVAARVVDGITQLAALSAEGAWGSLPAGVAPGLVTGLLKAESVLGTVATDGAAVVHVTGVLPDGNVSTKRWLERSGGLSSASAGAVLARGRDLIEDYPMLRLALLAGEVSEDQARAITRGLVPVLRAFTTELRPDLRGQAESALLDAAKNGATVKELTRAVQRLGYALDPDGASQAMLDAYDDQYLRLTPVGAGVQVDGYLSGETGAALATALEQVIDGWHRSGSLAPEEQPVPGETAEQHQRRLRRPHLLALALGDLATRALDGGLLGAKHDQRPHLTVTVHADDLARGIGGTLHLPGLDELFVPVTTVQRIWCDAAVSPVLTRPDHRADTRLSPSVRGIVDTALRESREVLWVGRSQRTATTRQRTALAVRHGGHCAFDGCHVDTSRCRAHHVLQWQHGGRTDLDALVPLCDRHHHAVHEGGWTIRRTSHPAGHPGAFTFHPPDPRQP